MPGRVTRTSPIVFWQRCSYEELLLKYLDRCVDGALTGPIHPPLRYDSAAIERALDAPNIRLSLVEDIGRAEAEAGAHVGVAQPSQQLFWSHKTTKPIPPNQQQVRPLMHPPL